MHHRSVGYNDRNYKSYLMGFILSLILTIIPFSVVMLDSGSESMLIAILVICAVVQITIHLVCFLHLNTSSEKRWHLMAFAFSLMIMTILVVGSLWIMSYLHYNLMTH
ncbi:cytochrome o ubiquinol oxidase subunit IV [secondary endosymbiont of Ctenarytaina eucalypti]|nr:cytochrome o ubiquinol oxidase subunit IV [secondary endosymbiont of Ctenarytaina eucalypti]